MTGMSDDLSISFELFPPKTEAGVTRLQDTVRQLSAAEPKYFSVTYGAGGTTRYRTARMVEMVANRTGLPVAQHFTCVGASRAEIDRQAEGFWESGIRKIAALRGDLPEGEMKWGESVLGPDGVIYCAPCNATGVLAIDTHAQTVTTFGNFPGRFKWGQSVLGPDGIIYCGPVSATEVRTLQSVPLR